MAGMTQLPRLTLYSKAGTCSLCDIAKEVLQRLRPKALPHRLEVVDITLQENKPVLSLHARRILLPSQAIVYCEQRVGYELQGGLERVCDFYRDGPRPTSYLSAGTRFARTLWLAAAHVALIKTSITTFCLGTITVSAIYFFLTNEGGPKFKISNQEIMRSFTHSLLVWASLLCIYSGLHDLGSARTFLLYEAVTCVFPRILHFFSRSSSPFRANNGGVVFILIGLAFIAVFDIVPTTFENETMTVPLTKSVLLVLCGSVMSVLASNAARRMMNEIGRRKRVGMISHVMTLAMFLVWRAFDTSQPQDQSMDVGIQKILLHIIVVGVAMGVDQAGQITVRAGSVLSYMDVFTIMICVGLLVWQQDSAHSGTLWGLTGYAVISLGMFGIVDDAVNSKRDIHLPFYDPNMKATNYQSKEGWSLGNVIRSVGDVLGTIVSHPESRTIFYFLLLNLTFTGVEFVYGVWTNSLGLMSDAFHMLFDCMALAVGLTASYIGRWPSNGTFTYGYGRVEVLSGFVNCIFLVVIALSINFEAIKRLWAPPHVHTENLLQVSFAGFLVNLVGMFALGHAHSHGSGQAHGHSHGSSHSHSHGEVQCENDEGAQNANMKGVFLHVMADTLGSVAVMTSSVLIEKFGWTISDPICSFAISILIILSVLPLLKDMTHILLQRTPVTSQKRLDNCLDKIHSLDGVVLCKPVHCWHHTSSRLTVTMHVIVTPTSNPQEVLNQVTRVMGSLGVYHLTIQ
eukprot:Ihof_evm2s208 gene=Ihof_evmTU2s208